MDAHHVPLFDHAAHRLKGSDNKLLPQIRCSPPQSLSLVSLSESLSESLSLSLSIDNHYSFLCCGFRWLCLGLDVCFVCLLRKCRILILIWPNPAQPRKHQTCTPLYCTRIAEYRNMWYGIRYWFLNSATCIMVLKYPTNCTIPCHHYKKIAYKGGFEKLKTASIDYQTASIDMNALQRRFSNRL